MLKSEKNIVPNPMPADRRAFARIPMRSVAYIELDDDNAGLILNVSEGGLGVQSAEMITGDHFERMILRLPKLEKWIEVGGRLVWISPSRKEAGIRFVDLSDDARQRIQHWIYSSSFRPGQPADQGRFKIVWESEEPDLSPGGVAPQDDLPDLEAMFPSEKKVPPKRHARMDDDPSIAAPSLELGIAPGPVKRQVIPAPVSPPVETVLNERSSAPTPNLSAQPQGKETVARRAYHYPPVLTDPKPSGDPFASIAQDMVAVGSPVSVASTASSANHVPPVGAAAANEPISPAFPLREHYRGLGYNPTPFEEPSGKGWYLAAAILIVLLGFGAIMAIGPSNVMATLGRHIPAISDDGPPPPSGATDRSPQSAVSSGDSGPFGAMTQQPLTNPGENSAQQTASPPAQPAPAPPQVEAPPTTTTVTGKATSKSPINDAPSGNTTTQNVSGRAEAPEATEEDPAAITRRFQMEHSGASAPNPTPAYQSPSAPREAQSGSSTNIATPPVNTSPTPEPQPDRAMDAYSERAPAPNAANSVSTTGSGAAGTVAVSSHFRSLRGEDPEATREREGLAIGQLISIHQPSYPVEAERSHTEGVVQLRATVDQLGKVEIVHAVSGPPMLLAAAIDAVREWRYAPTTVNGKAVESVNDVNVVFRLGNSVASPR